MSGGRHIRKKARDYGELLRSGRWFAALPAAFQDALLDAAVLRPLADGELLFSRGDPPSGLFAMVDGTLRITAVAETGKEALLTLVEVPAWFGEISVFDGLPRTHDAIADGDALVLVVPQAALERILDGEPRHWRHLALLVTGKMRLAFSALEEAAVMPAAARLARRLLLIAEGYGERRRGSSRVVEVRQEQLAMMLSLSRQTVNQLLKDLEAKKLVRVSYGGIELVDLDGLRAEAGNG